MNTTERIKTQLRKPAGIPNGTKGGDKVRFLIAKWEEAGMPALEPADVERVSRLTIHITGNQRAALSLAGHGSMIGGVFNLLK